MNKKYPFKSDFLAPSKMHFKKLLTFMNRNEIYKKVPSKKSNFLKWMNWKVFFFEKESFFHGKRWSLRKLCTFYENKNFYAFILQHILMCFPQGSAKKHLYIVFLNECQTYAQMANIDVHYRDLGVWNESTKILINPCFCK